LPERSGWGPAPAAGPAEEPASLAGQKPVSPSTPEAGENLTDLVERATVLVLVDGPAELTRGTGFFITPNIILTNRHVIDDLRKNRARALVTSKALGGAVEARLLRSTRPDELRDYAFLEVSPPPGRNPAVLALSLEIRRADHISSWGYPALFVKTDPQMAALLAGDISAVPEVVYSEGVVSVVQDLDGLPLINHTAEVSHGNSGGPLVNGRGEVVGINTMIRVDEQSNRQVNIALGSRDIINFAAGLGLTLAVR
jgi:S1-C subfamily serine protease